MAHPLGEGVLAIAVGAATAVTVGFTPIPRLILVLLAVALLVVLVIYASPRLAAVLLGLSIPMVTDVTGGHLGLHVAVSDLLLVIIGARVLMAGTVPQRLPAVRALRPVAIPVLQYVWLVVALLVIHLGATSVLKSVQRLELFALPMLVGAFIGLRRQHLLVLRAYVLSATVLAVVFPELNPASGIGALLQVQKNPVGGFIVGAILLLLSVRGLRRLLWCLPVLLVGLGLTESRGAILGLIVGVATISLGFSAGSRRLIFARTAAIAATGLLVFFLLPGSVTTRITSYAASSSSRAGWAVIYREEFYTDAAQIIAAHPWLGIGVGNYVAGVGTAASTTDPHNVILLEAAEGGYLFAASFVWLILGVAYVIWRHRRTELAAAAAGVLLASVAHGMVDVYWVRGTPVLGWLLVGMVCGLAARRSSGTVPAVDIA